MLEKFHITCVAENHWTLADESGADDKIIRLRGEYDKFWRKIKRGENFALARYGNGELDLILGKQVYSADGWSSMGGGITSLGKALRESLNIDAPNFYYGISCPCCDSAAYYRYLRHVKSPNLTFANMWVNGNFKAFKEDFAKLKRDAVLITNWRGKDKTFGRLNVKRHYLVGDDCIKFWESDGDKLINQIIAEVGQEKNLLYVVSAGPMSEVIIAALFKHNPDNCYVDFGSATDLITHGRINRGYVRENSPTAKRNCWMFDSKKISIDVDVVLTCYKRPQVLAQQLAAVKNQTLAPRRVFLYQDGIDDYYKVELNDKILSAFDACKISSTNGGVWKRFEFAAEIAKSPYVCLFDDDTIPGARWFENCHMNMMQARGVYVTNGILVRNFTDYRDNRLWAGWNTANVKTCAVDFGGHSWFLEWEYLSRMLAKPWSKKYKVVGEDMTISAAAAELGFGTYAPQHPAQILSLWGSLPQFGSKYGESDVAISKNPSAPDKMRAAFNEVHSDGWRCLLEENPDYLQEFVEAFKPSIFLGERKYWEFVREVYSWRAADYKVISDDKGQIHMDKIFSHLRRGAMHIFFIDAYGGLKPYFERAGMKEFVDFADGRGALFTATN